MKKSLMFRKIVTVLLTTVLLITAPGCSQGGPSASTSTSSGSSSSVKSAAGQDTLVVGIITDPLTLDPNDNNMQASHTVKRNIYEPLVTIDDDNNVVPCLAESWEYEDDYTLVFHLRKGVLFHNGEELKASDVIFTLNRIREMGAAKLAVEKVDFEKTAAVDDYTVKVVTTKPFAAQIKYFEWPLTCIFNEKAYKESEGDFLKAPIGTGPYKLKQWISGDRIELVANEDYWEEGKPKIKNVIMRLITESANRSMELESGGIDIAYEIPASDIPRLEENPDTDVVRSLCLNTNYIAINNSKKPFDDARVRKAIAYAVDVEKAVKSAYKGTGLVAEGFFTPTVEGFNNNVELIKYNLEKAKELLAEAGYPDGFKTTIMTDNTQERIDIATIFQSQLAAVGIDVEIVQLEQGAMVAAYERSQHDLLTVGFTSTTGEASRALGFFHKDNPVQSVWRWYNDEFSDLVDKASATMDLEERVKLYQQAQEIMLEEYPVIPTLHREILNAKRSYVKGFNNNRTFESHILKDVYFDFSGK